MANLVSLDDIKTFMQITTTTSDALLTVYRDMIEAEIDAFCDNKLRQDTYSEALEYLQAGKDLDQTYPFELDQGRPSFFVDYYPYSSLTLLNDGSTVSTTSYVEFPSQGRIETKTYFDTSDKKIVANYTAGYTTVTAPSDLQAVVKLGVKSIYDNSKASASTSGKGGNVKSKSVKDFSVSYGDTQDSYIQRSSINGESIIVKTYIASNDFILNRYKRINL